MKKKSKKLKPLKSVYHNQIIETTQWSHQVTEMFFCGKAALNLVNGYKLELEIFNQLKSGQIIICTTFGSIIGIAKDCNDRFRLITLP